MQRRVNPREARRMMQRMGMSMDSIGDVTQVIIKTAGKDILIEGPEVAIMQMGGQKIFQVVGGIVTERASQKEEPAGVSKGKPAVSEDDAQLVADQTGKSLEEARLALEECEGDLAKAILLLQS